MAAAVALLALPAPAAAEPEWHLRDAADLGCYDDPFFTTIVGAVGFYYDEERPPKVNEYVPMSVYAANVGVYPPCPMTVEIEAAFPAQVSAAVMPEAPVLCSSTVFGVEGSDDVTSPPEPCRARVEAATYVDGLFTGHASSLRIAPADAEGWPVPAGTAQELRLGAVFHEPRTPSEGSGAAAGAFAFRFPGDDPSNSPRGLLDPASDLPVRAGKPLAINLADASAREAARSGFPIFPAASEGGKVKASLTVDRKGALRLGLADRVQGKSLTLARAALAIEADSLERVVMKLRKAFRKPLARAGERKLGRARFAVDAELRGSGGRRITRVKQPVELVASPQAPRSQFGLRR